MKKKYQRNSFIVYAEKYEVGQGMEDGFELFTDVVTNGWVTCEGLVKIQQADGSVMCPFIQNRRGILFIRENDYIIYEQDGQRHCCGGDKFSKRFQDIWD